MAASRRRDWLSHTANVASLRRNNARQRQPVVSLARALSPAPDTAEGCPILTSVRINTLQPAPRLQLTVDRLQAEALRLNVSEVFSSIQLRLAPVYADDFLYQGRVLRVLLQADAAYRSGPESLAHFYWPNANHAMIPL